MCYSAYGEKEVVVGTYQRNQHSSKQMPAYRFEVCTKIEISESYYHYYYYYCYYYLQQLSFHSVAVVLTLVTNRNKYT